MGSVLPLRDFIRQRLDAAAEEIFSEVEKTIIRLEEELAAQSKLLAVCLKPQVRLQRLGRSDVHLHLWRFLSLRSTLLDVPTVETHQTNLPINEGSDSCGFNDCYYQQGRMWENMGPWAADVEQKVPL